MPYANRDQANQYQREYRRMRRSGDDCTTPCTAQVPSGFRLKRAQDAITLLEGQVAVLLNDESLGTIERAKTLTYMINTLLKAISAADIEARVEGIEIALNRRSR